MNILVFAGAGTSVELGVPAMAGMASEFMAHAEQWDVQPEMVKRLMGGVLDVEQIIESVDRLCAAKGPITTIGSDLASIAAAEQIRSELEWFVQHVAERIAAPDASLMWGGVLRASERHTMTFVTTNYDRAIELAANADNIRMSDGFESLSSGEAAKWKGFSPQVDRRLIKLHGSTDWYWDRHTDTPVKLRHPMPLFGRGTLRLADEMELGASLVLPSREKVLTRDPYPRLHQAFLNAVDSCEGAVFVGSSMRDPHIRSAAKDLTITGRPVIVVNRRGSSLGVDGALALAETASQFLISTLPTALRESNPFTSMAVSRRDGALGGPPLLETLRVTFDEQAGSAARCQALETCEGLGVSLDGKLMSRLLSDGDVLVAKHALGLIRPGQVDLLRAATESRHSADSRFAEELVLLESMFALP